MTCEIISVADRMVPITALPYAFFAASYLGKTTMCGHRASAGETRLQHRNTGPKGVILWRQGTKHIDGGRQNRDRVDVKRMAIQRLAHGVAQQIDPAQQQVTMTVREADRKEICRTWDAVVAVV